MRNLLALAAAAVLAFIVVGWFRGWYQISSKPSGTGREYDVNFNSPKISEDVHKGEEKVRDLLNNKIKQTSSQAQNPPVHQTVVPGTPATVPPTPNASAVPPVSAPAQPMPPQ
jgi:hypothetical protein